MTYIRAFRKRTTFDLQTIVLIFKMSIYDRLEIIIFSFIAAIRALVVLFLPIIKFCLSDAISTVDLMTLTALSWVIDNAFAYYAFESG